MSRSALMMLVVGLLGGWIVAHELPVVSARGAAMDEFRMATADTVGVYSVATGRVQGRDADCLFVWNHENQKLAVYSVTSNALQVLHVRSCKYDFKADDFNADGRRSTPTVTKMKQKVKPKPPK